MSSKRKRHSGKSQPSSGKKTKTSSKRHLSPVVRFVLVFVVALIIGGYAYAYLSASYHGPFEWLSRVMAQLSGGLASVFSSNVRCVNDLVSYNGFSVKIIDECTGVFEVVIYTIAVLAYPATLRKRLLGVAAGVPIIFGVNIVRLTILMMAGAKSYDLFLFLHLYLWQITLILIIAGVWVAWLYLVVYRDDKTTPVVSG